MAIEETTRDTMLDSIPTTVYLALSVGDLGNGGGGTECSGTGYARIAVTLSASSGAARTNSSGPHVFTVGAGGWQAAVDYAAIYSASSGGTLLATDALTSTRDMSAEGTTMTFAAGDLDLALS